MVFNSANTLTDPANYDRFYLQYLETSLMRYTGEMQDLVGSVSAGFTIQIHYFKLRLFLWHVSVKELKKHGKTCVKRLLKN